MQEDRDFFIKDSASDYFKDKKDLSFVKIAPGNSLNEAYIESICAYTTNPVKTLSSKKWKEDKVIRMFGSQKIRSVIITTDGRLILSDVRPDTLRGRCSFEYILAGGTDHSYIRKDLVFLCSSRMNIPLKRILKNAKDPDDESTCYIHLCGKTKVGSYLYMNSGTIYGISKVM